MQIKKQLLAPFVLLALMFGLSVFQWIYWWDFVTVPF
jgi:hypothetical protein